jgi:hypothetical protein
MLDADGKPIELGRGAMGVTYKAFDVDLHCPVTLKVINERYLGANFTSTRPKRLMSCSRVSPSTNSIA